MKNFKRLFLCLTLVAIGLLTAACGAKETPYEVNNTEHYTVSVKFDANGGYFHTNTTVIMDSYNPSQLPKDEGGNAYIALIPPTDEARTDKFNVLRNGYFLVGWYQERTVTTDENGVEQYTYSGKWDFEKDTVSVDLAGKYSAENPVLTLYAAWLPIFEIEYYSLDSGELLSSVKYNPTEADVITLPVWDKETGTLNLNSVPAREGFTYKAMYLDAERSLPVTTETLQHTAAINYENATAENTTMKLYVDWDKGNWYQIYTAQQLMNNASLDGCYKIMADLDFTDAYWPAVFSEQDMTQAFNGQIIGNRHTISNVVLERMNADRGGLFGTLGAAAKIEGLTFDRVEYILGGYVRMPGSAYGVVCGNADEGVTITDVQVTNSVLKIDTEIMIDTDDYGIGLVCGRGAIPVDFAGVTCEKTGETPDKIVINVTDNTVSVEAVPVE